MRTRQQQCEPIEKRDRQQCKKCERVDSPCEAPYSPDQCHPHRKEVIKLEDQVSRLRLARINAQKIQCGRIALINPVVLQIALQIRTALQFLHDLVVRIDAPALDEMMRYVGVKTLVLSAEHVVVSGQPKEQGNQQQQREMSPARLHARPSRSETARSERI